jgi:hypothetical protein
MSSGVLCGLIYLMMPSHIHILHNVECSDDYNLCNSKDVEVPGRNIFNNVIQ